jgi:hypothetical protein
MRPKVLFQTADNLIIATLNIEDVSPYA